MNSNEAYQILGLSPGASKNKINAAFRKKAAKLHPDVNKNENATKEFKKLNEAYQILKNYNPYDVSREIHFNDYSINFDVFFNDFFGVEVGTEINAEVNISFIESVKGCSKSVTWTRNAPCSVCQGKGKKNNPVRYEMPKMQRQWKKILCRQSC